MKPDFIFPDWPAPKNIKAVTTTRTGGYSQSPFDSFNLATHVEDEHDAVIKNRKILIEALQLPSEPIWLEQVHSTVAIEATNKNRKADASHTNQANTVCAVMTADCLPVLFCNKQGTQVAAAHAGWHGLADGILESTIEAMNKKPDELMAWMGPAIGAKVFEVGDEVRDAFTKGLPQAEQAFTQTKPGHWLADMYLLARQRLEQKGIMDIYGGGYCTHTEKDRFYSYRRDGKTGRMASLIWIEQV